VGSGSDDIGFAGTHCCARNESHSGRPLASKGFPIVAEVILLGTKGGPAIRQGGPSPSASLLVKDGVPLVIDCGLGVTRGFVEAGFPLASLVGIVITHHHSDHNLEFGNLIHTAWTAGLSRPVSCFGPPGLARMWRDFQRLNRFDIATRIADEGRPPLDALVTIAEYGPGDVATWNGIRIEAMRNNHPPILDSFALRFSFTDEAGKPQRVVFSGDTTAIPEMVDFAKGADLLVHEAMHVQGMEAVLKRLPNATRLRQHLVASHAPAENVGRIATDARVGCLVLNHLVPADDHGTTESDWIAAVRETYAGPIEIGRDGLRLSL
jgi:ribonuclease BN (tRNA processing enzyme)